MPKIEGARTATRACYPPRDVSPVDEQTRRGFVRYAWGVLGATVAVILFGAVVRITGSGAGCGQHWPSCQGEIVHLPRTLATVIELTHRVTSGLAALLVLGLAILASRQLPRGHVSRRAACWSCLFMLVEVLLGALLVLLRWVADDTSVERVLVQPAHLANTCFLSGALVLVPWFGARSAPQLRFSFRATWPLLLALLGVLLVMATGAVTALGDTIFPVRTGTSVVSSLSDTQLPDVHLLRRLRAIHPLMAVGLAAFLFYLASSVVAAHDERRLVELAATTKVLVLVQVAAGVATVWLSAPGWLQVLHLALGLLVWMVLVLLFATLLACGAAPERGGLGGPEASLIGRGGP